VKLPTLDISRSLAPALERLLGDASAREPERTSKRERRAELAAGAALVAACVAIQATWPDGELRAGPAATLTAAYALATRARFYVGAGYTAPTQLVLVPMLFLLPAGLVPLCAAAGYVVGLLPDIARRHVAPDRLLLRIPDAWHAVGPALVFAAADVDSVTWGDGWIYAGAFGAQLFADSAAAVSREWLALGVAPALQFAVLARVYVIDALLTPIGLLAAYAAADSPYRSLLVLPLVGVLAIFAEERRANVENALQLSNAYRGTALLLGDVLEDKDAYTASHSHGVVSLSLAVADRLRLDPAARRRVEFGALLHDIGKIAVPAEIINKPGPLDDDEWAVMKLHTVEGQQMLDRVGGVLAEVGLVVRASHEHWDGSGYPDGRAGEQIPIEARIVCACDAFSAMTTDRSYRRAMSDEAARDELVRCSGHQFDPRVVVALLGVLDGGTPALTVAQGA
jgi:HD-GYP domain-containing protein (c-di-GMP phosphodiesterase class II)